MVEDSDSDEENDEDDNRDGSFDALGNASGAQGFGMLGYDNFGQSQ